MFHVPEGCRIKTGLAGSDASYGNNGAFRVFFMGCHWSIIASDGDGWEHVSVSSPDKTPSWEVMDRIKALFWDPEDCVVQYHPPASSYVNFHPHCLHLWRPAGLEMPRPPIYMVGPVTGKEEL